jgi:hypothetical protein
MSGDSLSVLLFLLGTAAAAALASLTAPKGWRMWTCALVACAFGLSALLFVSRPSALPVESIWRMVIAFSPLMAVSLSILASGGRRVRDLKHGNARLQAVQPNPLRAEPVIDQLDSIVSQVLPIREAFVPPKLEESVETAATSPLSEPNPILTANFLNDLVHGGTQLEAKRRLSEYKGQRTKLSGQVEEIHENFDKKVMVTIVGLNIRWGNPMRTNQEYQFPPEQLDILEAIRPGDWIEFTGEVEYETACGWRLVNCRFVGRAPTPKPKTPGIRPSKPRGPKAKVPTPPDGQ